MTEREQASVVTADLPVVNNLIWAGHRPMTSLIHLTSFDYAVGIGYLPVYVNPAQVAYVQARRRYDSKNDVTTLDGTLLYFQQEAGVLAVREGIDKVLAAVGEVRS